MAAETTPRVCELARNAASDYLDGHESAPVREEIERHLGVCSNCKSFFEELRFIIDELAQLRLDAETEEAEKEALQTFCEGTRARSIESRITDQVNQAQLDLEDLSQVSEQKPLELGAADLGADSLELCARLLTKAEEKVSNDPREALRLAERGVELAKSVNVVADERDLLASCWAGLSVARAAVSDLCGAKEALEKAQIACSYGVRSPLTRGRVFAATCWIARDLGKLDQAAHAGQKAYEAFVAMGERQRALCSKIMLGTVFAEAGRNAEAIQALSDALSLVVEENDPPRQLLAVQMNLSLVYCEVGQPEEVVRQLAGMKRLAQKVGGDAPLHLRWLEGTVARVLGDWQSALRSFFEVREHFQSRRECLHYLESSLDALRVYVETDNWAAGGQLVVETVRECREMTREPELLGVLEVLEEDAITRGLTELQICALRKLVADRVKAGWIS